MANEPKEPMQPENEGEPQVFSVVRDINGTQFRRRDFIEKAIVTTAAVSVIATGCSSPSSASKVDVQATVNSAISATENSSKVTQVAAAEATKAIEPPKATETSLPDPTDTPVPTDTPIPATPTLTSTPKPQGIEFTIKGDTVNFRSGPGTGYAPITRLEFGTIIHLTSRLADSSWVGVAFGNPKKPGTFVEGWIKTNLVDTRGKDISSLPVITNIPPTPTPLPGKGGNTKPGEKGLDYQYTDEYGNTYNLNLPCGSTLPAGSVCTCNCVTVPRTCSCVDNTPAGCSCNPIHYWYPN